MNSVIRSVLMVAAVVLVAASGHQTNSGEGSSFKSEGRSEASAPHGMGGPNLSDDTADSSDAALADGLAALNYTKTVAQQCSLFGWTFFDGLGPPEMVSDPMVSYYGASIVNLFWGSVTDAPCGPFDWLGYSVVAKFNGFEGPEPRVRVTQSWTNNPKCCGSGKYFPYACKVAEFKYTPRADGRQDLEIHSLSDNKFPILTVKGIWYSPSWLSAAFPPTNEWAPSLLRWYLQDVSTITNGTADGKPVKVGNRLNTANYGDVRMGLCGIDSWEGPARANMPGGVATLGTGISSPTVAYTQFMPYF
eukprot:jgi/Botrbrau1/13541/Bobra.4_2s0002.1